MNTKPTVRSTLSYLWRELWSHAGRENLQFRLQGKASLQRNWASQSRTREYGKMEKWLYSSISRVRNRHLLIFDVVIFSLTPAMSLALRLEKMDEVMLFALPLAGYTVVSMLLKLGVFHTWRFYQHLWRYASVAEIMTIASATTSAWLLCIAGFFLVRAFTGLIPVGFPQSLPFIDGVLTILLVGGARLALRVAHSLNERRQPAGSSTNVLIVGAGISGSTIVKELLENPQLGIKPVCYVDDAPAKQGAMIHGMKVAGTLKDIPRLIGEYGIKEVIIAMPKASGEVIRGVVQACKNENVASRTIPSMFEILSGSAVAQLREVKIEDLLRRGVVKIETEDVAKLLAGARVMVTGAGGSIGSELCRQIVSFRPKELVLLGHGEDSIFQIAQELRNRHGLISEPVPIHAVIADIRAKDRMNHLLGFYRPQIIFHAAGHKHVGLMETNMFDAVENNVEGTKTLVDLADKYEVERLVMISTDKAVNPTCAMGVTKRVAELVVHDAAERTGRNFVVVRFGNVLGSSGSVLPLFRKQIREGGPLKITHPDVTRFFMTIPEAVQLVLQAGTMGRGGEIFVLDMGEPIKILDLARDLLRLSGLREGVDIKIEFIGLQKGEKMHEALFYEAEIIERSRHEKILVCSNGIGLTTVPVTAWTLVQKVRGLITAAHEGNIERVQSALVDIVPQYRVNGYEPSASGESSVKKGLASTIQPAHAGGRQAIGQSNVAGK